MIENNRLGKLKRFWDMARQPSGRYSPISIALIFFAGAIFLGSFYITIEATNTLEFCITCHEMRDTVYQEYKQTIHYNNRTGVQATCPDCHVPRHLGRKILRKVMASFELWGKLTGTIDTPNKFEAKRMEMATREWDRMKAAESIECRNCHGFERMDTSKQSPLAKINHDMAIENNMTCIDCHKGIAHKLP